MLDPLTLTVVAALLLSTTVLIVRIIVRNRKSRVSGADKAAGDSNELHATGQSPALRESAAQTGRPETVAGRTGPSPQEVTEERDGETDCINEPTLSYDYMASLEERIERYLEEEKPYLQRRFTPADLARELNVPLYHITCYFKWHLNRKFTNYRTELRIRHACSLMEDDQMQTLTVETVSELCGYSSRSTFYENFRKHTGLTPTEYLIRSREEQNGPS